MEKGKGSGMGVESGVTEKRDERDEEQKC